MELDIEPSSSVEFDALAEQLAELEDHYLTIVESDTVVGALEAKIDLHKRRSGCSSATRPLPYANVKAFLFGWVQKCEAAAEKARFEARAIDRRNTELRALVKRKRQSIGNDALRVHMESFRLEGIFGNSELETARQVVHELRLLGADVKREILLEKLAAYDTNQRRGRLAQDATRWKARLDGVRAKIDRTEREIETLEQQNEKLRAVLRRHKPPSVVEIASRTQELRQLQAQLFRTVKRGILAGSIEVAPGGVGEDAPIAR
uniref:DUF4201 domain-containing protein n=1 Tax=Anopheles farauti TaxID=69004 RepID=A0A182QVA6_9DIPT